MTIIKNFIYSLSQSLPLSRGDDNEFYNFIKQQFDLYIEKLSLLPQNELSSFIAESKEMNGNASAKRFLNLIKDIQDQCLNILQLAYKGDSYSAIKRLEQLLTVQKFTKYRLNDMLVNYFVLGDEYGETLYRCVDFNKCEVPDNCWHVPYNMKYKASRGRFNQLGTICMYLSNSKDCASKELGEVDDVKKNRWVGEFRPKMMLYLYNFVIPSREEIERMNAYEQFCFLLTYPFYMLCLTKTGHSSSPFCEEYLFPQLFFQMLFIQPNNKCPRFDGIKYTSMHIPDSINIVILAKYSSEIPPKDGYSKHIKSLLEAIKEPYVL